MEVICILCPKGCELFLNSEGGSLQVMGNSCPKGIQFGMQEWRQPMRSLSSTVRTTSEKFPRVPVKTSGMIPKEMQFEIMSAINAITVSLPVTMGEILISNICGLGVDLIATADQEGHS